MGKNSFKTPEPEQQPIQESPKKGEPRVEKKTKSDVSIRSWFDGTILTKKFVAKMIPMFFFIFFLGMIFIANRYVIEKTSLEITRMKSHIDELQMRRTQVNGEYMRAQKITEIARELEILEVRESISQPKKIVIKE